MRVLVTGATGFVGNLLARRFVAEGHEVIGVTSGHWKPRVPPPGVEPGHLHNVLYGGQFDALVHAAGPSNVRTCHEQPVVVGRALQDWSALLERAWVNRAQVILLSSHSVYGMQERQPISEDVVLAPRSIYGAMKAAQETLGFAFHHAKGLGVTALRCVTLVGGAERPDALVRRLTEAAIAGNITLDGGGTQARGVCDVEDAVDAVVRCLGREDLAGEAYNIGSGVSVRIIDLAGLIADEVALVTRHRPEITVVVPRSHEEGNLDVNMGKAWIAGLLPVGDVPLSKHAVFGQPRSWEDAVRRTVKWCVENQKG